MIKQLAIFLIIACTQLSISQIDPCAFADKSAISNNKKVGKIYGKAKKLQQDQKKSEALELLEKALELDTTCAKCHYSAAKILDRKGKLGPAQEHYIAIDKTCPIYKADLYYNIGSIAYLRSKQVVDNQEDLLKCAEFFGKYLEFGDPKKTKYKRAALKCRECINLFELYSDTVDFDRSKLKGVSENGSDEYLPFASPDNKTLYYTKKYKIESKGLASYAKNGEWRSSIFKATLSPNAANDVEELQYPFNQEGIKQGAATLTLNNKEMYITICGKHPLNIGYCDIFYTKKVDGKWQELQNLNDFADKPINTESYESMPSISADGKVLFFVSDRHDKHLIKKAEMGDRQAIEHIDYDIYFTVKEENGKWSTPKRLGPQINSEKDEKTPYIHPDNSTLYFSSEGHYGLGGYDIFYSKKNSEGSWDFAKNLGIPINTSLDDGDFFASLDGQRGYYASRPSGTAMWEVFQFELHNEARPEKLMLMKGKVNNSSSENPTKIKVRNNNTGEEEEIEVDSENGEYSFIARIQEDDDSNDNKNQTSTAKDAIRQKLEGIKNKIKSEEELKKIIESFPIAPEDSMAVENIEISSNPESFLSPNSRKTGTIKYAPVQGKKTKKISFTISTQTKGSIIQTNTVESDNLESNNTLQKIDFENKAITKGSKFTVKNLLFAVDSYELTPEAQSRLYPLLDFLELNNEVKISIEGHTDNIGSTSKNKELSKNRAQAVANFLIKNGITSDRIQSKGHGSTKPVASNLTEEGKSKNRRTEIVIL